MKYVSSLCVALLIGVTGAAIGSGPTRAQQGLDLVKQAVAAQGGAEALRGLKAVSIKVKGRHWEPGQSYAPGGEPRFLGESDISVTWDLAKDAARNVWDRSMKYPAVEQLKFTEVVMPDLGSVTDQKGTQAMSGIRVATLLRELDRASARRSATGHELDQHPVADVVELEAVGVGEDQQERDHHPEQRGGERLGEILAEDRQHRAADQNDEADLVNEGGHVVGRERAGHAGAVAREQHDQRQGEREDDPGKQTAHGALARIIRWPGAGIAGAGRDPPSGVGARRRTSVSNP